jgi:hypothetical protein
LIHSLAVYGFVAAASLLFGSTMLRWLRPELSRSVRFCLSPLVTATTWAWLLALGMRLGHSMRGTSIIVWLITLLVVGLGVLGKVHKHWPARWLVVVCLLMPMVALAPAFWYGLDAYFHYMMCDPSGYSGAARHAWMYHFREAYTDLKPVYMAFTAYRELRATSHALIGFFSRLYIPGETQMALNICLAHSLLMLAGAMAALVRALRLRAWAVVMAILLLGSSRWLGCVIFMGSWDHLFTLAYLPGCLVLAGARRAFSWRSALLLGSFLGAASLAYPEGLFFILVPVLGCLGWRLLTSLRKYRRHLLFAGQTLVSCFLFLHVEMRMVAHTLQYSFTAAMSSPSSVNNRPGGNALSGMLGNSPLPAFFGMGPEWGPQWGTFQPPAWALPLQELAAWLLCFALLAGFLVLLLRGRADLPFAIGVLLAGSLHFLIHHQYPYAAYKPLTFAWPLMVAVAVCAIAAAWRVRFRVLGAGMGMLMCLAMAWCMSPFWIPRAFPPSAPASQSLREFHELQKTITRLTHGGPILLAAQNVATNFWLEFFLRDEPIYNAFPTPRFEALPPTTSRPHRSEAQFLITDGLQIPIPLEGGCWQPIYRSESFVLWTHYTNAEVTQMYEQCLYYPRIEWGTGFFPEETEGAMRRWHLCGPCGELAIWNPSDRPKLVVLQLLAQTYTPGTAELTLKSPLFSESLSISERGAAFNRIIEVPPGRHVIQCACTATPYVEPTRTIVFAFHNHTLREVNTEALVVWGTGFFPEEQEGAHRWRWCGAQGDLEITNPSNRPKSLVFEFLAQTYSPGTAPLTLRSSFFSEDIPVHERGVPISRILAVPPGRHRIHFACAAAPYVHPARTLVFALHNFMVKEVDSPAKTARLGKP